MYTSHRVIVVTKYDNLSGVVYLFNVGLLMLRKE